VVDRNLPEIDASVTNIKQKFPAVFEAAVLPTMVSHRVLAHACEVPIAEISVHPRQSWAYSSGPNDFKLKHYH
jgi:hypothetical protein